EAELDIAEAYVWYERRRIGLGEEFLSSVDVCMEVIRRQPEMYPLVHEAYRRSLVCDFQSCARNHVTEVGQAIRLPSQTRQANRLPHLSHRLFNPASDGGQAGLMDCGAVMLAGAGRQHRAPHNFRSGGLK